MFLIFHIFDHFVIIVKIFNPDDAQNVRKRFKFLIYKVDIFLCFLAFMILSSFLLGMFFDRAETFQGRASFWGNQHNALRKPTPSMVT